LYACKCSGESDSRVLGQIFVCTEYPLLRQEYEKKLRAKNEQQLQKPEVSRT
jgi:predicted ATP-dependent serine protease